jgi:hypothetical protein
MMLVMAALFATQLVVVEGAASTLPVAAASATTPTTDSPNFIGSKINYYTSFDLLPRIL